MAHRLRFFCELFVAFSSAVLLPYATVLDWSVRAAPLTAIVLLLYCCDGGVVDGWVVGGGCLVGVGSLAIHEIDVDLL